jgi:hypothetical protein
MNLEDKQGDIRQKIAPEGIFASEALAFERTKKYKMKTGTSSWHWRSVVRSYWRSQ